MKEININRRNKKLYFYVISSILFIALIVTVAVQSATIGSELAFYEQEETKLIAENESLKDRVIRNESLESYSKKSGEMGFIKPVEVIYSDIRSEVAKLP